MLSKPKAVDLVSEWMPEWHRNRNRIDAIDAWLVGDNELPFSPKQSTREYQNLRKKAISPYLRLVTSVVVQSMVVDGYRRSDEVDNAAGWDIWQANRWDRVQSEVHWSTVGHGWSFGSVSAGDPVPVMRGWSARSMIAAYGDEAVDEWPVFAMALRPSGNAWLCRVFDEEAVYFLGMTDSMSKPEFIEARAHDLGVCPVVRYVNVSDLDGRAVGEVEPYIPIAQRIDQTTFDRLVVQRLASWKVRTVAGMARPDNAQEKEALARILEVGDLLVSESPDTKFGTLPETPLSGFIEAKDSDIRELAATTQTPPVDLLGQVANQPAEGYQAAKFSSERKRDMRKLSIGESHEQMLRLAGLASGDVDAWQDFSAQVIWKDVDNMNLARVADAYGKLATMLGVPAKFLWEKIPGWTMQDVERARQMSEDEDSIAKLTEVITAQMAPETPDVADG